MDIIFFLAQIDRLRKERKLTKAEFYEKADITASAVSQWRNEKTVPAETTIQRIADLFGVEVSFLTGEQKNPVPKTEDGIMPPKEYADLNATNKAIVDRLIADLARSQLKNPPSDDSQE